MRGDGALRPAPGDRTLRRQRGALRPVAGAPAPGRTDPRAARRDRAGGGACAGPCRAGFGLAAAGRAGRDGGDGRTARRRLEVEWRQAARALRRRRAAAAGHGARRRGNGGVPGRGRQRRPAARGRAGAGRPPLRRYRAHGLPGRCRARLGLAGEALEQAADAARVALCAEALGAMQALLEATRDHVSARRQFGQPLGRFQAVQHRLVDML
ncbi:acyl-CoA dehydrogenase family protein, partial [Achromobacter denitrificans]|uniref:acyl-CoA dehydrogenase family protein n=1 Tax=Achromobacter denitrificans TaxID=32002 RepID=UPI003530E47B